MGVRYDSILHTVGHTPVVRINNLAPEGINLYVKVESFNPMGSVKDRLALGVIEDAESRGELQPGQTIVEATSGNTGIGLAMVCAQKGYPLVITMAENFSVERRRLMRFLGAKVILTPAAEKGTGMVNKARELAEKHGWWQPRQFENPANAEVHARTTAVEILDDFADTTLDYWVTGTGTSGTLSGVSRVLRQRSPQTRIVVCEPDNSPILGSGEPQPQGQSHPRFRPHLMQGWTPDFIPGLANEVLEQQRIDRFMPIDGKDALHWSRQLACREGILVGISSGATFAGALAIAREAEPGSNILCMLPDTGERYISTPLFEDIPAEMSELELQLSRSTPGYRFDATGSAAVPTQVPEVDAETAAWLQSVIADPDQPVVMFALEWCEFCWSVRKLFEQLGIPYRSIDVDSVAYQENNRGGIIREWLRQQTESVTLPQIFIGGEFRGGCTDMFDGYTGGTLAGWLSENGIQPRSVEGLDPWALLPGWLHPR
ncbi:cysteine synthase A [Pseudomaricurvus sp. HS19]|nr:cysteine synthase A [Pseudomaricurvus sp. HS19]